MIDKLDPTFRFYQDAANLRGHRQQLIASNIANADTPKYKAPRHRFSGCVTRRDGWKWR